MTATRWRWPTSPSLCRRAAPRASLRSIFVERLGGRVGDPAADPAARRVRRGRGGLRCGRAARSILRPPIAAIDRLLYLAPLVRAWKRRLPAHVAALFEEEMVVPASSADAIWLARDLAGLMDEIETEGSDWTRLADLAPGNLSGWWQVTLDFLSIVTERWPEFLAERAAIQSGRAPQRADPAGGRTAEAQSARRTGDRGGFDRLDPRDRRTAVGDRAPAARRGRSAGPRQGAGRAVLGGAFGRCAKARRPRPSAIRPGEAARQDRHSARRCRRDRNAATGAGTARPAGVGSAAAGRNHRRMGRPPRARFLLETSPLALSGVTLVEAPRERDEAAAIAIALRQAVSDPGRNAALVTGDRELARRVSAELLRFGVRADDSGGTPLANTPPGDASRPDAPGDVQAGRPGSGAGLAEASAAIAWNAARQGSSRGRNDRAGGAARRHRPPGRRQRLGDLFETRLHEIVGDRRPPFWLARLTGERLAAAREILARLGAALKPLAAFREARHRQSLRRSSAPQSSRWKRWGAARTAASPNSTPAMPAKSLPNSCAAWSARPRRFDFSPGEWPDIMARADRAGNRQAGAGRGTAGSPSGARSKRGCRASTRWSSAGSTRAAGRARPRPTASCRGIMKTGLDLEPPERRIGQAAHDFIMAMGAKQVVLTRSARAGEAPAVPSRWLQRLLTFAGKDETGKMRARRRPAARLGARPRRRPAGEIRQPPGAEAAACLAPGPFLGDRDRDAAARPLCDLCAAHPEAACRSIRCCAIPARPSAARCSTKSCTAFRRPASIRATRRQPTCCWRKAASAFPNWLSLPMSRRSGGRASRSLRAPIIAWERPVPTG